ncbi:hypothetical protein TIFTF001_013662 [Ficus carica]|uniref:Folylpolyglutamate synthase n=1 Tax=Ficus carica TaxID=3494 RepID=A0AA87ZVC3_FICCA|nr:hypothetical protein TIFTF001_013662 [Ficus carica]
MEFLHHGGSFKGLCSRSAEEEPELKDFMEYMDSLKNYEKSGVPKDAGTDSDDGFDLGRMRRLMELLDNPHSKFKVPHIQTIRERISFGRLGEPVSAKSLNDLFHRSKKIINKAMELENGRISHFEVLTAMAFKLFAQENVDIAVIEAGLGGARDATNVICSSGLATSVITTIGEEHLAALGGSLKSIAMAKSGIIKHKRPVSGMNFQLVLGGRFLPHIKQILQDKALSMSSPVVSASDAGNRSKIKGISLLNDRPCQSCDIVIQVGNYFNLSFELFDVKLYMLGSHQLQNAVTATCTALCLRDLEDKAGIQSNSILDPSGWQISDGSIRAGLENTCLLGRSQFLTSMEAERLGLSKAMIMLDGAHTKESAKALVHTIRMTFPGARLALVVAMASDKDHVGFAREFLSGGKIDAVFLTQANIAGGKSRTTLASFLRDCWIKASGELGLAFLNDKTMEYQDLLKAQSNGCEGVLENKTILAAEASVLSSMKIANQILSHNMQKGSGIIVVTGSLHIVSSVLATLHE